jgi:hypothetical protein
MKSYSLAIREKARSLNQNSSLDDLLMRKKKRRQMPRLKLTLNLQ